MCKFSFHFHLYHMNLIVKNEQTECYEDDLKSSLLHWIGIFVIPLYCYLLWEPKKALPKWIIFLLLVSHNTVSCFNTLTCMLIFYSQKGEDEAMFVESEISPLVSYAGEVRVNDLTFYCSNKGVKLKSQGLLTCMYTSSLIWTWFNLVSFQITFRNVQEQNRSYLSNWISYLLL